MAPSGISGGGGEPSPSTAAGIRAVVGVFTRINGNKAWKGNRVMGASKIEGCESQQAVESCGQLSSITGAFLMLS